METCTCCKQELSEPARLLPCLHSACYGCLESRLIQTDETSQFGDGSYPRLDQDQRVTCPNCGVEADLPKGGLRCLPLDPRALDCLVQRCQLCSTTPTLAFCKCDECELFMCALCAETHIKFGDVGGHSIFQLQDERIRVSPREQRWCNQHRTEEGSYFCWDCRTTVCSKCCSGHKLEDVSGAAVRLKSQVSEAMSIAHTALKQASSVSTSAAALTASINDRCDAVAREVDLFIEGYKEALQSHHSALLAQIEQIRESRTDLAEQCRDRLENWISTANHILQFASYVTTNASPTQVVSVGSWTLDRLGEVSNSSSFVRQPNVSDWVQFLPDERSGGAQRFMLTGIISTQAVSPYHSAIETTGGVLNCKQHTKATFVLTTRDLENKVLSHGGEKIGAEVFYKDASQRSLPVDVSDEGDGSYTVSFRPDAAGTLLLSVLVRGVHCKGSPYTVAVSSTRQHKGVFHCCAFCSSGGSKTATCACGAKMPGGYKGCGHGHVGHPGRRHWSCCGNVLQNSECGRPITHQYSF